MRSSLLAVIAIIGTMSNDVSAVSLQNHHHHPHHHRLVMDKEDPENAAIAAAIKKEELDNKVAEEAAAKKEKLENLKDELKAEAAPKILSEDEEKAKTQADINQLANDALAVENTKKIDDIKEKIENLKEAPKAKENPNAAAEIADLKSK